MKRENCNCHPQVLYIRQCCGPRNTYSGSESKIPSNSVSESGSGSDPQKRPRMKITIVLAEEAEAGLFKHPTNPDLQHY